jgi:hypothetical protein|tara:strand:- start:133 stop:333 length:201 start_codon:yes stop_codon:yes gene_type:complete
MSTKESLINHLATLMDRHRALDKKVADDYHNRVNDSIIQQEKFDKLALKQEIAALQIEIGMIQKQA